MTKTSVIKILMLLTIIVTSVSSLSITFIPYTVWAGNNEVSAWTTCTLDEDCAPVGTDCCESNFGQAVNVKHVKDWYKTHAKEICPSDMACNAVIPEAHCHGGQCAAGPKPMNVPMSSCTSDQDCVAINTADCCRDDIAIHKNFINAFRDLHPLPPNCSYVECPIGTLPARCINNMCKIINAFDQGSYQ